jgi:hypothetical protein
MELRGECTRCGISYCLPKFIDDGDLCPECGDWEPSDYASED